MVSPAEGLARLRQAAESGGLDELCERHRIRVLTVFGSAARGEPWARDLDVAVITDQGARLDVLALLTDLAELSGSEQVDLVHLNHGGPVIREHALVGSVALYESTPGAMADAQSAAIAERIDTDPMRRLDMKLLAR